jgi:hypothetical protein
MRDSNKSTRLAQARTLPTAVNWGEEWSRDEIEVIAGFPDDTAEELARALGRTVYAVQAIREDLLHGRRDAQGRQRPKPAPAFAFTFAKGWRD